MKKIKQIMAIIGLIVIAGLYIWAFVAAIMARPEANAMFVAAIICTVVIPIMLYVITWLARVFSGKDLLEAVEHQARMEKEKEEKEKGKK
jgi:Na+/melibiose symporter-like transporter